ncbi:MAG: 5-methyltetrahydropteroyltriglutamate--homocysteine S-methyltransferase [Rudaea sp.]|uniref:5-methyltetrahydropteroyltriglutamate-- homocysteine S-methyltransferase n=1 Tax=unclassified Rudaea TaxID=2627037 RepID=UPI0010F8EB4D|nr:MULTISPECIES: 5-methyltetrahydropteroyltriglutamate--homocysteine S-methyltransferase [unclassified Rudaea]MBN8886449.1 5-methyltetrahydropteroyltriglutamate--homocysteine S-methyltransferase [Rudaea sp.]
MSLVTNLGFPRIGRKRELKTALENYWKGAIDADALRETARELRQRHWQLQRDAGADVVPVNDFTLYDHVLDTAWLFGAVPQEYLELAQNDPLAGYFATARGYKAGGRDLRALEMTKWFDTNYHYLVPELTRDQVFTLRGDKPIAEFLEARALGHTARPVLLGPVSFLLLSKTVDGSDRLALLDKLVPVYAELLGKLADAGADWVQLDEPLLALDLCDAARHAFRYAYATLAEARTPKLLLATYFSGLDENLDLALSLPAHGLHIDLVRAPQLLDAVLDHLPDDRVLSLGVVDGRNIWRTDLHAALGLIKRARAAISAHRLQIAPSCSLLHVPIDASPEAALEIHPWLAFAREKVAELRTLADAAEGKEAALAAIAASRELQKSRRASKLTVNAAVRERVKQTTAQLEQRQSDYEARRLKQAQALGLPAYPTTTIGSFPQTAEVRHARASHRAGKLSDAEYRTFLENETAQTVRIQEELDIDVLVHGEFERNDMVEYFGEQLDGFAFTKQGWVQSYGSRCVKPPIIYGDVSRPQPMTVAWSRYAQSLTQRVMKGMLTGPVTILQWSFVRDDQPRADTCRQIALALRDEVVDLETAGIRVIQIDEPALREGLPLRRRDWDAYLAWAVACFRVAAAGVRDETQIHTHMCYAEFNDIIDAVAALDADVISIETSRSRMELLEAFTRFRYPSGIGPGVYDIHSPRVPEYDDMLGLLRKAQARLKPEQLWVNPDCGLKTRGWPEVKAALGAMVAAAKALRQEA